MIKNSFKTFAKNIVYLFIPMGIVYLFILIAVFMFIAAVGNNVGNTISDIVALLNASVQGSAESVREFLTYAVGQIDWNANFLTTLKQIVDTQWLRNTVKGFFLTINQSTEGFETQFAVIIQVFKNKLIADIVSAVSLIIIGIFAANFVTRFAVHHRSAKRNVKEFIVAHTLVPLFQSLIIIVFLVLLVVIGPYSFLVASALAVLAAVMSLFSSWLIHRNDSLKLRDVLNAKNVLKHIAVVGIILLMNVVLAVILMLIDPLLAILLMIPFAIYSFNIADVNTEAYVSSLIEEHMNADGIKQ